MVNGMPIGFLVSTWLAVAGLLVGLFETFDRWNRSVWVCATAAIMLLVGAAGLAMTWKRATRMSYRAAVRKRRKLGKDATSPSLHPLVLGKLLSDTAENDRMAASGDSGKPRAAAARRQSR
jgi:hypothetical protein